MKKRFRIYLYIVRSIFLDSIIASWLISILHGLFQNAENCRQKCQKYLTVRQCGRNQTTVQESTVFHSLMSQSSRVLLCDWHLFSTDYSDFYNLSIPATILKLKGTSGMSWSSLVHLKYVSAYFKKAIACPADARQVMRHRKSSTSPERDDLTWLYEILCSEFQPLPTRRCTRALQN